MSSDASSASTGFMLMQARGLYNLTKQHHLVGDMRGHHAGDMKWSARTADYGGWMVCDGRTLARAAYPTLFSVIGTAYGNPSPTTFKLPDCRGRVLGAPGTAPGAGAVPRALGAAVGSEVHTMTVNQMPEHSHSASTSAGGDHTHSTNANGGSLGLASANGTNTVNDVDSSPGELNVWTLPAPLVVNPTSAHTHAVTVANAGSGQAFSIMQPTIFCGNVFVYSGHTEPSALDALVVGEDDRSITSP